LLPSARLYLGNKILVQNRFLEAEKQRLKQPESYFDRLCQQYFELMTVVDSSLSGFAYFVQGCMLDLVVLAWLQQVECPTEA
jgi:hypothetical protein